LSERQVWLDMAKGTGIILVVIAHVADNSTRPLAPVVFAGLSLFFMPLFFVISGFLHTPNERGHFFWKRVRTLLVPYFVFLGMIMAAILVLEALRGDLPAPWQIRERLVDAALGGRFLVRELGVFWFVTCLFFTQIIYNEIALRTRGPTDPRAIAFVCASVVLAYAIQAYWPDLYSPLAIAQVPLGIGAFWFGNLLRDRGFAPLPALMLVGAVLVVATVARMHGADFTFSMKNGIYGPPLLGLLVALALSLCVLVAVRLVEDVRALSIPLTALGEASLVIMFQHQFVHFSLRDLGLSDELALVLLSVAIPYAMFWLVRSSKVLSPWFLGHGDLSISLRRVVHAFGTRHP
jgi:fucose 4-O-acetylase-like acetyltransferase